MGHVNPQLLQEFLLLIDLPLFCNNKKAEELHFVYHEDEGRVGLYIDNVLLQWVSREVWARFSL